MSWFRRIRHRLRVITSIADFPDNSADLGQSSAAASKQLKKLQSLRQEYRSRRVVRRNNNGGASSSWWRDLSIIGSKYDFIIGRLDTKRNTFLFLWLNLIVDVIICIFGLISIQLETFMNSWYLIQRPYWLYMSLVATSLFNVTTTILRGLFSRDIQGYGRWINMISIVDLITAVPFIV